MEQTSVNPALGPLDATTGDERAVLEAFLDFHRAIVTVKVRGVSDADARGRLLPSQTTLAGVVKHLTLVEQNWFPGLLDPAPGEEYVASPEAGDESWTVLDTDTLAELSDSYERACARSRAVAASFPLDHVVPHPQVGQVSLRWIYVHMIEETARHVGHADIVRELTDGSTGVF